MIDLQRTVDHLGPHLGEQERLEVLKPAPLTRMRFPLILCSALKDFHIVAIPAKGWVFEYDERKWKTAAVA